MRKLCLCALAAALSISAAFFAGRAMADDDPNKKLGAAAGEKEPSNPEMEAWGKVALPGENHKLLAQYAGSWESTATMTMIPNAPPTQSKGTVESRMVLGGRFLQSEHKAIYMGQPWEGLGHIGFDNVKQKFVTTWMDSMGTLIVTGIGAYDAATKTITEVGEYDDPMTGGKTTKKVRNLWKLTSDKEYSFEMYEIGADGKEKKALEITYKRK
ncbi:MAG: DUF1579 domain-containing protein [Planctomycetes bacterium]|nr:DUF1579 domain-containing protein [Planctomycetota bacterium]